MNPEKCTKCFAYNSQIKMCDIALRHISCVDFCPLGRDEKIVNYGYGKMTNRREKEIIGNILVLMIFIILTAMCIYKYSRIPSPCGFGICLFSAMLVGCWAMIVVDDVKKRHRSKDE